MKRYDIIWIGTGQATATVIPRLVAAGKTVAIAEGGRVGGSCVNYGCTPTKTIVASARAAHMARRGADFGVNIDNFTIDFDKVMARQNAIRNDISERMESWLAGMDGVDLYKAYAHFEDDHTIRVQRPGHHWGHDCDSCRCAGKGAVNAGSRASQLAG